MPPPAYPEAVAALAARGRFGIHLGLGRIRALLAVLGDPQAGMRGALIAGTNGKGSVQALCGAMLLAAGHRVGQTPKPHLVEYRERIVVDGEPIAPDDMGGLLGRVLDVAERVPRRLGPPTEFEVVTAAAFAWFAARGVDVAVVEVGLGGRLDATNAWDGGVAAVTNVAMDHAEVLGSTIPAIAREKAAILKRGDRAVTGATGDALSVVRRRAGRLGIPLREVGSLPVLGMDRDGLRVEVPGVGEVGMRLLGRHQARNAAVALAIVDELEATGIATVGPGARRAGMERATWPGRLELVEVPAAGRPPVDVLLDGAHNPDGIRVLLDALGELRPSLAGGTPTLVLAIMRDKDVTSMLEALAADPVLRDARLVATRVGERGLGASDLASRFDDARRAGGGPRALEPSAAIDDPIEAFDAALGRAAAEGGPVIVAGSLYLVGAVRGALQQRGLVR